MGGVVSLTISAGIDYLAGSLTAMLWEWIFNKYSPDTPKYRNLIEGLLQMGATIATSNLFASVLTPNSFAKDSTIGMIGVIFFAFMYSPNMRAKLQSMHVTVRDTFLFVPGGFMENKVTPNMDYRNEKAANDQQFEKKHAMMANEQK